MVRIGVAWWLLIGGIATAGEFQWLSSPQCLSGCPVGTIGTPDGILTSTTLTESTPIGTVSLDYFATREFEVLSSGLFEVDSTVTVGGSGIACNPFSCVDAVQLGVTSSAGSGAQSVPVSPYLSPFAQIVLTSESMTEMFLHRGDYSITQWFRGSVSAGEYPFLAVNFTTSLSDPPIPEPRGLLVPLILLVGLIGWREYHTTRRWEY